MLTCVLHKILENFVFMCHHNCFYFVLARKETAREKILKEEEKILESVAEKQGESAVMVLEAYIINCRFDVTKLSWF